MRVIKPIQITTNGSFSRASSGTYLDVNAVLNVASTDEPRFNYNSVTKDFEGLLIEPESENSLTYSEELWNTTYWDVGSTLDSLYTASSSTDVVDVYGTSGNSLKLVAEVTTGTKFLRKNISLGIETYSPSIFVYVPTQVGVNTFRLFATFEDTEVSDYSSELDVFDRWVRVEIPSTLLAATRADVTFNIEVNNVTPTSGFTFYVSAAQLEVGSRHTSYIPNTSTATTRSADVITGAGLIYTDLTNAYSDWSNATTYAIGERVSYNNRYWESLQNSNLNKDPTTSPTFWLDIGPDNRHAALDSTISTVSSKLEEFTIVLKPGVQFDSYALINIDAATIKVAITEPNEGTIYSNIFGLSGIEVFDWYQYFFFDPTARRTQIVDSGIPLYVNSVITIRVQTSSIDDASIGHITLGTYNDLGLTRWGVNSGIVDYSIKSTDEFGNTSFVERPYSKRMNANIFVRNNDLNRVQRLFYDLRATPSVWIASDDPNFEEALIVYGFYRDFNMEIAYPQHSLCNLEIEGLT